MLTRLLVRNFKTIEEADIELGSTVVLIGPNNSGKTSALQALALWQSGLRRWTERRGDSKARERPGVTLSRAALTHTPVPEARALWRDLRVSASGGNGKGAPTVFIDVLVEGQTDDATWRCGLEFYHANPESIYCRPMRTDNGGTGDRMPVPDVAAETRIAFLPPMSGLVIEEEEHKSGRIDVLIGEGRTAEVLRNLCLRVWEHRPDAWVRLKQAVQRMFGVILHDPERVPERGSIRVVYKQEDTVFDIASAGRGLQQAILLLAHIAGNPGSVLLFDEPDAHLEILRQREVYDLIVDEARAAGSQVIAASHSEVVLDAAAQRDVVIGFVGRPHRVNGPISQLRKSLKDIPFDHYYQARVKSRVLYLEGATDLRLLQGFAELVNHPVREALREPFVHFVADLPNKAAEHYYGLREAVPTLRGFALFDRLTRTMPSGFSLPYHCWTRREFENYIASPIVLRRFAVRDESTELLTFGGRGRRMEEAIAAVEEANRVLGRDAWSVDVKASEDLLPPIFANFYERLGIRNEMNKADFHELVSFLRPDEVAPEVISVLDAVQRELAPT